MNGFDKVVCILTGLEHSGTTFSQQLICSHPDVFCGFEAGIMCNDNFLHPACIPFNSWIYEQGFHWGLDNKIKLSKQTMGEKYQLLFDFKGSGHENCNIQKLIKDCNLIIDKTPRYFETPQLLHRVLRNTPPNIPIIVTVKDFGNTLASFIKWRAVAPDFQEFVKQSNKDWDEFYRKRFNYALGRLSRLLETLKFVEKSFQRDRIYIFLHSDIAQNTDSYIARLQEILSYKLSFEEDLSKNKYRSKIGETPYAYSNWVYKNEENEEILDLAKNHLEMRENVNQLIHQLKEKI